MSIDRDMMPRGQALRARKDLMPVLPMVEMAVCVVSIGRRGGHMPMYRVCDAGKDRCGICRGVVGWIRISAARDASRVGDQQRRVETHVHCHCNRWIAAAYGQRIAARAGQGAENASPACAAD